MTPSTRKKGIVTSLGVLTAVATLLSGGVTTAYANDALANTALMQQLAAHPIYTVAQFAQAVGAIYYACLSL